MTRIALIGFLLLASAASARAQQALSPQAPQRKTMAALRMAPTETIVLDGRLDEAAWSRAVPAAHPL